MGAVVVITEADKLSKDAQHALRRIMEKYMSNCRYVLCCNSTNKASSTRNAENALILCLGHRAASQPLPDHPRRGADCG